MSESTPRVSLSVESHYESIELVLVVLEDVMERLRVPEEDASALGAGVREAMANAILHGHREDAAKHVQVEFALLDGEIVVEIRDQGEGFDPEQISDPIAPENLLQLRGRGILLMKHFVDRVEFGSDASGTVVTLRKAVGVLTVGKRRNRRRRL